MEVDHFNPTLKNKLRHRYSNLMLSCGFINNHKRAGWPTPEDRRSGCEFINPCKEQDYGSEIFEEPETGKLVGATTRARYHIDMLDLNNGSLVSERRERQIWNLLYQGSAPIVYDVATIDTAHLALAFANDTFSKYIPPIPPPPKKSPHPA